MATDPAAPSPAATPPAARAPRTGRRARKRNAARAAAQTLAEHPVVAGASCSAGDAASIASFLGYTPTNLVAVAARDAADGSPVALTLQPISESRRSTRDGHVRTAAAAGQRVPFPTIYWLIGKPHALVSRLEDAGLVALAEARLARNPAARAALAGAHEAYARARLALLSEADTALMVERGWERALRDTGIAGMRRHPTGVKCLHTHYAHHLAAPDAGNPIGQWVSEWIDADRAGTLLGLVAAERMKKARPPTDEAWAVVVERTRRIVFRVPEGTGYDQAVAEAGKWNDATAAQRGFRARPISLSRALADGYAEGAAPPPPPRSAAALLAVAASRARDGGSSGYLNLRASSLTVAELPAVAELWRRTDRPVDALRAAGGVEADADAGAAGSDDGNALAAAAAAAGSDDDDDTDAPARRPSPAGAARWTQLGLTDNGGDASLVPVLCDLLEGDSGALEGLYLSKCAAGPAGAARLAAALAAQGKNGTIARLGLNWNAVLDSGAAALAASLTCGRLAVLGLSGNGLTCAGAVSLARGLADAPALRKLFVGDNSVGDQGAAALAAAAADAGTLERLGLAGNRIGAAGAEAVAAACARWGARLDRICLYDNPCLAHEHVVALLGAIGAVNLKRAHR